MWGTLYVVIACALRVGFLLMFVVGGRKVLGAWQLSSQIVRFMDHDRQALRAKMISLAAIFKRQQRDFI